MDSLNVPSSMLSIENQMLINCQLAGGFDGTIWKLRWTEVGGSEVAPSCPRCTSPNTKFCYYNNYSLSQPRYFCKSCRRYWTRGGSLRNVPVGGGCRRSRRRRSRAAKPSRPADPFSSTPTTPMSSNSNSSGSEDGQDRAIDYSDVTPEIDLAAVFAKFLNPGLARESDVDTFSVVPNDDVISDPMMFATHDAAQHGELGIVQGNELGGLDGSMLSDGLWLDDVAEPSFPSYTWQHETLLETSANSWSSTVDFSGFEILSSTLIN